MSERGLTQDSLERWQVESLRVTAFPSPAAQVQNPAWWSELVGEPPETRLTHPRYGGSQEEGVFRAGKLRLSIAAPRIEWVFLVPDEQRSDGDSLFTIGALPDVLPLFQELIASWFTLETYPPIIRLAFGAVLRQPAASHDDAYQRLGMYLPSVILDPAGSSDFLYQINRPRESTSGIAGLKINRLSKWAAVRVVEFAGSPMPLVHYPHMATYFARLELDINTITDFQEELGKEQWQLVFHELVKLGHEIATRGDIP